MSNLPKSIDQPKFFERAKEIKNKCALIIDDLDLKQISPEEAKIKMNKLWLDFIYTFTVKVLPKVGH